MMAVVTIGFVKDAKHHIDVQGFNVYHKNRLIKVLIVLNNFTNNDSLGYMVSSNLPFFTPSPFINKTFVAWVLSCFYGCTLNSLSRSLDMLL